MSEHTPGPWVGFLDQRKPAAIMRAMRPGDICTFDMPPTQADFALMIAAPDLLAALKMAEGQLVEFWMNGGGGSEAVDTVRAVIAKATAG